MKKFLIADSSTDKPTNGYPNRGGMVKGGKALKELTLSFWKKYRRGDEDGIKSVKKGAFFKNRFGTFFVKVSGEIWFEATGTELYAFLEGRENTFFKKNYIDLN